MASLMLRRMRCLGTGARAFSTMPKLRPLGDRVLVKKVTPVTQTAGGILLPEAAQTKINQGVVIAVGEGLKYDGKPVPLNVKVGEKVLLPEYGGQVLKLTEESKDEFVLFRDEDLLAILED